jgi:uncharacterized protein involved in cysteine biosynthesis
VLKLTSKFVLQVLPYLLVALAAGVLLPGVTEALIAAAFNGVLSSPPHEIETMIEPFGHDRTPLDLVRQGHEVFAPHLSLPEIAKAAE